MKIQTLLNQIDFGHIALSEFQRGAVWNRDHVDDRAVPRGAVSVCLTC